MNQISQQNDKDSPNVSKSRIATELVGTVVVRHLNHSAKTNKAFLVHLFNDYNINFVYLQCKKCIKTLAKIKLYLLVTPTKKNSFAIQNMPYEGSFNF